MAFPWITQSTWLREIVPKFVDLYRQSSDPTQPRRYFKGECPWIKLDLQPNVPCLEELIKNQMTLLCFEFGYFGLAVGGRSECGETWLWGRGTGGPFIIQATAFESKWPNAIAKSTECPLPPFVEPVFDIHTRKTLGSLTAVSKTQHTSVKDCVKEELQISTPSGKDTFTNTNSRPRGYLDKKQMQAYRDLVRESKGAKREIKEMFGPIGVRRGATSYAQSKVQGLPRNEALLSRLPGANTTQQASSSADPMHSVGMTPKLKTTPAETVDRADSDPRTSIVDSIRKWVLAEDSEKLDDIFHAEKASNSTESVDQDEASTALEPSKKDLEKVRWPRQDSVSNMAIKYDHTFHPAPMPCQQVSRPISMLELSPWKLVSEEIIRADADGIFEKSNDRHTKALDEALKARLSGIAGWKESLRAAIESNNVEKVGEGYVAPWPPAAAVPFPTMSSEAAADPLKPAGCRETSGSSMWELRTAEKSKKPDPSFPEQYTQYHGPKVDNSLSFEPKPHIGEMLQDTMREELEAPNNAERDACSTVATDGIEHSYTPPDGKSRATLGVSDLRDSFSPEPFVTSLASQEVPEKRAADELEFTRETGNPSASGSLDGGWEDLANE